MKQATHILGVYPTADSEMLFRAADGVCIGMRKSETVVFGDEPNKRRSRIFIDKEHATKWLKTTCAEWDLKEYPQKFYDSGKDRDKVVLEERNMEGAIIRLPDSIEFPANGPTPRRN
jgi:hypothetical protein